ncbi:MAG: KilA-N domain-containing protein [Bacteroidales bacterium]
MITNQVITRQLGDFTVTQRTKDGFFNANELLSQWNSSISAKRKRMVEFNESSNTKEFIIALENDLSHCRKIDHGDNQAVKEIKGRQTKNGRTKDQVWMHPYLFIKFAMWINPTFELTVIKFVYDEMIKYRNEAGDAYRVLAAAVKKIVSDSFMQTAMKKVSEGVNWVVFNSHEKAIRNKKGSDYDQRRLSDFETKLAELITDGFINDFDSLISYMRKQYQLKYNPKVFTEKFAD